MSYSKLNKEEIDKSITRLRELYPDLVDIQITIGYLSKENIKKGLIVESSTKEYNSIVSKFLGTGKTLVSIQMAESEKFFKYTIRNNPNFENKVYEYRIDEFSLSEATQYAVWSELISKSNYCYTDVWISFNNLIKNKGIYLNTFITLNLSDEALVEGFIHNFSNVLKVFYFDFLIDIVMAEWSASLTREAIKSAKAAIMGRNMSHNLGSHVLYYLRQHFNLDVDMLNQLLYNLEFVDKGNDNVQIGLKGINTNLIAKSQLELPFLKGIGTFMAYLQERQDFIAAVATDYVPSFTTVNFKDFVIDNFTKDKKALRHSGQTKQEENILLKYIAKSEDVDVEIKFQGEYLGDKIGFNSDGKTVYDFYLDMPGGILGRQAFYSILENIIRNAAKHSKRIDERTSLELNIKIQDPTIDSCYESATQGNLNAWKDKYYWVTIIDNCISSDIIADNINKSLQKPLIDENFKLIEDSKGIKEIMISALWLCGSSVSDLEKPEDRLKYVFAKFDHQNQNLSYNLFLLKSKLLIVIIDKSDNSIHHFNQLREIAIIDKDTFFKNLEDVKRYELVIDTTSENKDIPNENEDKNRENIGSYKEGLKRYLKVKFETLIKLLKLDNLNQHSFSKLFEEYIRKQYYYGSVEEYENIFPKFVFNIESKDGNTTIVTTENYKKLLCNLKGNQLSDEPIEFTEGEYKDSYKLVAFKRHIHDKPLEFFWPQEPDEKNNFNMKENKVLTVIKDKEKIGESQEKIFLEKIEKAVGKKGKFLSIETITGDNASFRLLNHTVIDDRWMLEQIEAANARILIIDERLFKTYHYFKMEGGEYPDNVVDWFYKLIKLMYDTYKINKENNISLNDRTKELFDLYNESKNDKRYKIIHQIIDCINLDDVKCIYDLNKPLFRNEYINKDNLEGLINANINSKINTEYIINHKGLLFKLKNIDIATIIDKKVVDIFGSEIGKISPTKIDGKDSEFDFNSFDLKTEFHYISVHQGILDKLLLNKNDTPEGEEKENKEFQITQSIKSLKDLTKIKAIVHTGRGKPNYIRGVCGFRSLSDLDYALREPKSILIDYFKSASYE